MSEVSNYPLVYIVILNYNGKHLLKDCLSSVMQIECPNFKAVVVDNGSTDGSEDFIRQNYLSIKLIKNKKNLGFARANNIGIEYALNAGANHIVLLNNDTLVKPNWINELIKVAESDSKIAICGSKILAWDKKTIEYAGRVFYKSLAGGGYNDEIDNGQYEEVRNAAYACGAGMMIKAEAIRRIGLFDPHFFAYNDDVDLGLRTWICGYKVAYVPAAIIYHKRGATSNEHFRTYLGMRNAWTTILKNYEIKTLLAVAKSNIKVYLSAKKVNLIRSIMFNLLILPWTMRSRYRIQKKRRVSDKEIFKMFSYFE